MFSPPRMIVSSARPLYEQIPGGRATRRSLVGNQPPASRRSRAPTSSAGTPRGRGPRALLSRLPRTCRLRPKSASQCLGLLACTASRATIFSSSEAIACSVASVQAARWSELVSVALKITTALFGKVRCTLEHRPWQCEHLRTKWSAGTATSRPRHRRHIRLCGSTSSDISIALGARSERASSSTSPG